MSPSPVSVTWVWNGTTRWSCLLGSCFLLRSYWLVSCSCITSTQISWLSVTSTTYLSGRCQGETARMLWFLIQLHMNRPSLPVCWYPLNKKYRILLWWRIWVTDTNCGYCLYLFSSGCLIILLYLCLSHLSVHPRLHSERKSSEAQSVWYLRCKSSVYPSLNVL